MNPVSRFLRRCCTAGFAAAVLALATPGFAADEFKSLFNGKDLSGWAGNYGFWFVREGAIVGQTTWATPTKGNTFLVWQGGDVKNFELRLMFRLTPNNDAAFANSGVQYRSKIVDQANWVVGGYQADMDFAGKYVGMLYEEKGRGILMQPGQQIRVQSGLDEKGKARVETAATPTSAADILAAYKKADWNELVIIANGNQLRHFLNGKLTADVTDLDEAHGAKSGLLALQLHAGQPMTVEFKDIRLKTLP
jgi:hypothetical protein